MEMLIGGLAVALALLAKAVAWLSGKYRLAWWRAFAFGATVIWVWMLLWDLFFKPANTEVAAVLVLLVLSASVGAALLANRSDGEPELSIGRQRGAAFGALIGLAGCVAPYLFLSNLAFPRIG